MGDPADRESANPWASPTVLKSRSGRGYQEPDFDQEDDVSINQISYPPPSQNPFNQSRLSAQKIANGERSSESGSLYLDTERIDDSTAGTTPTMYTADTAASPLDQDLTGYNFSPSSGIENKRGPNGHVVLGVAVVDFNHLLGPTVDWSYPPSLTKVLSKDEELTRLLPFLALPDGAHLVSAKLKRTDCLISDKHAFAYM
ncbi:hypothetical protein QFC19_009335 [Naganishia cerealis]|uniref:Uncharacterized protein n=1 Tax=Naganishia cerealis TaxID=610337 RepID=A0ACC2UWQ6_9TREE|nr:hypothetical protein QFC19_009335 [Naganishia cerealis]